MKVTNILSPHGFDVLTAGTVGNQHGIGGFNDDKIVYADETHQTTGGMDQGIAAVGGENVTDVGVAGFVFGRYAALPTLDSRPDSEIIEYDEIGLPK